MFRYQPHLMIKIKNVFNCILAISVLSFHSTMTPGAAAAGPAIAFRSVLGGFFKYLFYSSLYANHIVKKGMVQQEPYASYTLSIDGLEQPHIYNALYDVSPYDHYFVTPCDGRSNEIGEENLCINTLSVAPSSYCPLSSSNSRPIDDIPDEDLMPSDKLPEKGLRAQHMRALLKSSMPDGAQVCIQYDMPTYISTSLGLDADMLFRQFTRALFNYTEGRIITYDSHDRGSSDHYLYPYRSRIIIDGGISPLSLLDYMERSLLSLPHREHSDYTALLNIQRLRDQLRLNSTGRVLTFRSRNLLSYDPIPLDGIRNFSRYWRSFFQSVPTLLWGATIRSDQSLQHANIDGPYRQAHILNNETSYTTS